MRCILEQLTVCFHGECGARKKPSPGRQSRPSEDGGFLQGHNTLRPDHSLVDSWSNVVSCVDWMFSIDLDFFLRNISICLVDRVLGFGLVVENN